MSFQVLPFGDSWNNLAALWAKIWNIYKPIGYGEQSWDWKCTFACHRAKISQKIPLWNTAACQKIQSMRLRALTSLKRENANTYLIRISNANTKLIGAEMKNAKIVSSFEYTMKKKKGLNLFFMDFFLPTFLGLFDFVAECISTLQAKRTKKKKRWFQVQGCLMLFSHSQPHKV